MIGHMSAKSCPALAPVIIIPGALTRAAAFEDVADALRDGGHPAEIIELPARGSRLAQLDRGGLAAIDTVLDERIALLDESPILVGHSLGGLMALRASRRNAVRALVLLMPAPPTGLWPVVLPDAVRHPRNAIRMLATAFSVTLGIRLGFGAPDGLYSSRATAEDVARGAAFRSDESWALLAATLFGSRKAVRAAGVPTLVVAGHQDRITPTRVLRPLADALEAELVEFDVAHAFNEEPTYRLVTDAVLDFLARNSPERRAVCGTTQEASLPRPE
jgi:pimeloyl-ACP methyl ester carboxylesterase